MLKLKYSYGRQEGSRGNWAVLKHQQHSWKTKLKYPVSRRHDALFYHHCVARDVKRASGLQLPALSGSLYSCFSLLPVIHRLWEQLAGDGWGGGSAAAAASDKISLFAPLCLQGAQGTAPLSPLSPLSSCYHSREGHCRHHNSLFGQFQPASLPRQHYNWPEKKSWVFVFPPIIWAERAENKHSRRFCFGQKTLKYYPCSLQKNYQFNDILQKRN